MYPSTLNENKYEKQSHNLVELKVKDLEKMKKFYNQAFGWKFIDYGPAYIAFTESGLDGGFEKTNENIVNGTLVVLYHKDLTGIKDKVVDAGGKISKDIFDFPGGRRFHFIDPPGNELAI